MATRRKTKQPRQKSTPPKPVNVGGRPTKLTRVLIHEICKYVMMGSYVETAAATCAVDKATFYGWLKKGRRDRNEGRYTTIYAELSFKILESLGKAETRDLIRIDQAGERDWRAAAWKMERRNAQRWGPKAALKMQSNDDDELTGVDNLHEQLANLIEEHEGAFGESGEETKD